MSSTFEPKWTPGPWETYNANEGTDYFPAWEVANDAYHNPPADEDAPWIAVHLTTGVKADAELIALAPELAAAVLAVDQWYRDNQQHVPECNAGGSLGALGTLAERLRMIGADE